MKLSFFIVIFLCCITCQKITAQETKPVGNEVAPLYSLPEYPGGQTEMNTFIQKNLTLPKKYVADSTFKPCLVFIKFMINEEGKVVEPQILKGCFGFDECDKEALRLVNKMPRWKPGTKDHKPYKRAFTIHISFAKS